MENQISPNRKNDPETQNEPETNRDHQEFDFPGYPHYPTRLDAMSGNKGGSREDVPQQYGTENSPGLSSYDQEDVLPSDANDPDQGDILDPNANVTEEDYLLLGDIDGDQDEGDDEVIDDEDLDDTDDDGDDLNEASGRRARSGGDLDVPDDELDNAGSAMEPEDEENDYYDLRGDIAEKLEDKESRNLF